MLKKKKIKPLIPTESQEQRCLIQWAKIIKFKFLGSLNDSKIEDRFISEFIFAIPNGGSRHKIEAKKLKEEGVTPGVPDLFFHVPRGIFCGLFIEMKRKKYSKTSIEQREYHKKLFECGYKVCVCKSFEEAKTAILNYLAPGCP